MFLLSFNIVNAQWQNTTPISFRNVESIASDGINLFAGTSGWGLLQSSNNGDTWNSANSGITNYWENEFGSIETNGTNIYAAAWDFNFGGGVYLSTNNGSSWTVMNNGMTSTSAISLGINDSNIFAGTFWGGLFLSTDYGNNWTAINNGLPTNTIVFSFFVNDTNIFAGTDTGIYLSTNNGALWTPINNGITAGNIKSFTKIGTTIIACGHGGLYKSTNNGSNWIDISNGISNFEVTSLTTFDSTLFVGNLDGVYLSSDTGGTWTDVSNGLPIQKSISSLAVCGPYVFLGDSEGVWRRPISEMVSIKENHDFLNLNIFPNPSNGKFKITNTNNIKNIEIQNILGKVIYCSTLNNFQTTTEIDLSTVSKGIYFVKLDNGEQIMTEKIIIN